MPSGSEEPELVRAAAAGDGPAFACLYEAYERPLFNYLLRLLGDRHEAEDATQDAFLRVMSRLPDLDQERLRFGPYLYAAARNAGYDVIAKRKKVKLSGFGPEEAADPACTERSDLESDPERAALADSQDEAVRVANERLPERQREVLALRELGGMSYDQIGSVMEIKPNAVAQLISRARVGLRREMQAGAVASIAPLSPDCEKAHGALATRQDDQPGRMDGWLDAHLASCPNCRVAQEEMAEAGASYRAWAPIVPAAWLFREVKAKASEMVGGDWTELERPGPGSRPGAKEPRAASRRRLRARRTALTGLAAVAVTGLLATVLLAEAEAPQREGLTRESLITRSTEPGPTVSEQAEKRSDPGVRSPEAAEVGGPDQTLVADEVATADGPDPPAARPDSRDLTSDRLGGGGSERATQPRPEPPREPVDPVAPETPAEPVPEPQPEPEPEPQPEPPVDVPVTDPKCPPVITVRPAC